MTHTDTLRSRVQALLEQKPNRWVDGYDLSRVGGYAAYRTRISELRKPRFGGLNIVNRQRRLVCQSGFVYRISEYMLVVPAQDQKTNETYARVVSLS